MLTSLPWSSPAILSVADRPTITNSPVTAYCTVGICADRNRSKWSSQPAISRHHAPATREQIMPPSPRA
jgi:hypothetical protein